MNAAAKSEEVQALNESLRQDIYALSCAAVRDPGNPSFPDELFERLRENLLALVALADDALAQLPPGGA